MWSHRSGHEVAVCDGCYRVIGRVSEPAAKFKRFTTIDGRSGHVCSPECGEKFSDNPPSKTEGVLEREAREAAQATPAVA